MQNHAAQDTVVGISRELVTQLAPQEGPLFRAMSTAWLKDPTIFSRAQTSDDDMLAFGVGEVMELLTPMILPVVSAMITVIGMNLASHPREREPENATQSVNSMFLQGREIDRGNMIPVTQRAKLRQKIVTGFDLNELRTICFDLAIDYDNLTGDTKEAKVVSLLLYCERIGKLPELIEHCHNLRSEHFIEYAGNAPSGFTADTLLRAQEAALNHARALNMPLDKAEAIASEVLNSLALT